MKFEETNLAPACLIRPQWHTDNRGEFARIHCEQEFEAEGLNGRVVQSSLSSTFKRGTVRGMHFQRAPSVEGKLVYCLRGRIFDAIIDLRPDSHSFCRSFGVELTDENHTALFVPPGFAHGHQSLEDDVLVLYQMTGYFEPTLSSGVRWNDPAFDLQWPLQVSLIDNRDAGYLDFDRTLVAGFEGY